MLVLSRKRNENIVIMTPQGDITVSVIQVRGGKIQLGIDAPKEISIYKGENIQHFRGDDSGDTTQPPAA